MSLSHMAQAVIGNDFKHNLCTQLAVCHCVKPANSAPGGKASLVIGSSKTVSKLERNVLLFSRPLCKLKSPAEWAGLPSLLADHSEH